MWPIFAASSSDFASPSQRLFLKGKLEYIVEHMGINQARIMFQADLLHPSTYIAREGMFKPPHAGQVRDAENDFLAAERSLPPPMLPLDMHLSISSPATAQALRLTPEPQLWTPPHLSQPLSSSQDQLWMPDLNTESLWGSPTPPDGYSTPILPVEKNRTWTTLPPADYIWNSPLEGSTPTSIWIPRSITEPLYVHDSYPKLPGPPITYQNPPDCKRDYHTFEHANSGATSSA